ncbi:glutamine synthetase [Anaerovorax odorimutans]|uniref:glutamine synthetase n=1 Tax=Anaerovorax odorimutans TaxID=109327 RepID=A0ABT1RK98_9FIRM|nr:glutamine synthetase [Anaerovorax odorimutans]MCQ4635599.1 glutamine synthetase [Anaerovorax odorimutans]
MLDFDLDKMLFTIPAENHSAEEITSLLRAHPEVRFVSLVGLDIGGHDTDEKIPVDLFIEDMEKFLHSGVQTDGSSVVLPKIAELNNAKVDIIPDTEVNWYVDHNFKHVDRETGLPVGTLRIPSFLIHNDVAEVGSRVILRDAIINFKKELLQIIKENPYVFEHLAIDSADEIEKLEITAATELEFWVKTPDDEADREQLSTAQILKEQYWKRTIGPVRTALEEVMLVLDKYGFEMEMGHKEVGGVKAKIGNSGNYDHVMEQLEIDWKFSTAIQAADNENQVKYVVRDIFRMHGLEVTFMAKPMEGVAGSGEHTHMGLAAKLKDGRRVNLFSAKDMKAEFLSPIGFGALMGILKNYEVVNPFVSATNDAFNRLKPGYEAPVCVVTSLGHGVEMPSRNRTVLVGLVRDVANPLATRFELRAPNPKSNTYLILASSYMAMLDGIKAALEAKKTPKELEASISKEYGQEDFYLEKDRLYRSERDVFEEYTEQERNELFGRVPRTVWENICAFADHPEKLKVFQRNDVMTPITLESYKEAIVAQWATELHNRIVPNTMDLIRHCVKCHDDSDCVDYDVVYWEKINTIRNLLGRDKLNEQCLLTRIVRALDKRDFETASGLQIEMQEKVKELTDLYIIYKKNLF